jgi:hypothetical protein
MKKVMHAQHGQGLGKFREGGWVRSSRQDQGARFENNGAGQSKIGTVMMLFCGLPAITRSL